jgi:lysophospholipase L1-like esterase
MMSRTLLLIVATLAVGPQSAQSTTPPAQASCPEMVAALQNVLRIDARLRDWAQLERYREANHSVPPATGAESRVVFIGDSITDSWQEPRFGGFFPGKPYLDRGISAQTTQQILVRFRADVIQLRPRVVVILAGTNDIAGNTGPMTDEEIEGNLASMAELATANGIRVVLSSLTPTADYHAAANARPQSTARPLARIQAINTWMREYAKAHGCVYLDYFSALIDASGAFRAEWSLDDLHPNAAGYAVMAPLAAAAIQKSLS